jgi:hypothetical protein
VVPQLRSELVALHLPTAAVDGAVRQFQVCFHDRANESDPSQTPPSCTRAAQQSPSPAVTAAFASAGAQALGHDFEDSVQRSLIYQIAVFTATFLMVFALPSARRAAARATGGAHAAH